MDNDTNHIKKSSGRIIFEVFLYLLLILVALSCILPFVNLLAISFSDSKYVKAGEVAFLPKGFTIASYQYVMSNANFFHSFGVTIQRTLLGVVINIFLIVMTAYPLASFDPGFKAKKIYMLFFVGALLFVPSLVPLYLVIRSLGMLDTIWALVLPTALPVFNMILMMNFFRSLPKGLDEAAFLDGAGHFKILWRIYVPLSKPAIATVTLFSIVAHWNSWFDGILYMNTTTNYPLQSYLQTLVVNAQQLVKASQSGSSTASMLKLINNDTAKAAQLFLAIIPVILVYPMLQKYFTSGLTAGGIKE